MLTLVAVLLPTLLVLIAFAIQYSYLDLSRVELRTAADAAAEAGARVLGETGSQTQALAAARAAAGRNLVSGEPFQLADADVQFGQVTRFSAADRFQFDSNSTNPNAVRVTAQANRAHIFQVLGADFSIRTRAIAGQSDVDIALVLDRSGSMVYVQDDGSPTHWTNGEPAPNNSRWVKLAQAADVFFDTLANEQPSNEFVSLITYNQAALIENELTDRFSDHSDAIDVYTQAYQDGATNIADGIELGRQSLVSGGFARSWAAKAIVLMTDGIHNTGTISPQDAAAVAAGQGIRIHTITYGDDANQTTMQEVATIGGGSHWHAPNSGALKQVFKKVAAHLPTMIME